MSEPREIPILRNAAQVRAILNGATQIRVPCKPQPPSKLHFACVGGKGFGFFDHEWNKHKSPFGGPGDLLWVRETWGSAADGNIFYRASDPGIHTNYTNVNGSLWPGWKSPVTMPKDAARIWLRVKRVWCQQVQSVSEADCWAEGITRAFNPWVFGCEVERAVTPPGKEVNRD